MLLLLFLLFFHHDPHPFLLCRVPVDGAYPPLCQGEQALCRDPITFNADIGAHVPDRSFLWRNLHRRSRCAQQKAGQGRESPPMARWHIYNFMTDEWGSSHGTEKSRRHSGLSENRRISLPYNGCFSARSHGIPHPPSLLVPGRSPSATQVRVTPLASQSRLFPVRTVSRM